MTRLTKWLNQLHPAHAIVDVSVDVVLVPYNQLCMICSDLIICARDENISVLDLFAAPTAAPVAYISFLAKGYTPGETLDSDGRPYMCDHCIDEAREIMRTSDLRPVRGWVEVMTDWTEKQEATRLLDQLQDWRDIRKVSGL